jgi:hypothetical protein
MTAIKRLVIVVAQIIIESAIWTTVFAVIVVILSKPLQSVLGIIDGFSMAAAGVVFAILLIAYLANLSTFNRSFDGFFTREKIWTLGLVMTGLFFIAVYADQLAPSYSKSQAVWGWLASILLFVLVLIVIAKLTRPGRTGFKKSKLYLDNPDNNQLKLTETQQVVYDRISVVLEESTDASIALTGNWGVGKTKILNDLKRNNEQILWFSFYPWAYTSEEALVKDFYVQLTESIDNVLPRITNQGNKVANSVKRLIDGKVIDNFLSTIANIVLDMMGKARNPEDLIYDRLKGQNLRVIVVVDDLERVSSSAIINRTLQLVHHLRRRNIKGVSFITAFEREAIIEALPSHIQGDGRLVFIEKFFDIEVLLPDPTPEDISHQLVENLPKQLVPSYIRQNLLRDLRSHRAVTRLANEYQLADSVKGIDTALNNIVNMDDFIVLTHIKIKYPSIYRDIAQNRHIYTQYAYSLDEESIAYRMMSSEDEQTEYKKKHLDNMFERSGLSMDTADRLRKMLADIFPDAAKALGEYSSSNQGEDTQRRERRVSLRTVLDATLGTFDNLAAIINHEMQVKRVMDTLARKHTEKDISKVVNGFMQYAISLGDDKWNSPLYILTNEISNRDEELRDDIPELTRALLKYGLELGEEYDNRLKVRLLGQAFHIFTDNLLYRGLPAEQKSEYVHQLSLVKLVDSSKTPYGSLLFARLELSREAIEVKKYLPREEINSMRLKARRHFERYYIKEGHDMVLEADDLFYHLDKGWEEMIGSYSVGKSIYNKWLQDIQRLHPSYFLDKFTTQTFRGNWAFKEDDFGTIRPAKDVTSEKLKTIIQLVNTIEGSDNLSEDDLERIKMIRNYSLEHSNNEQVDEQTIVEV